ncbi:MAG: hydroxymethylglutaryl-CoA lyase [Gammaproteobacteria bacterium]|nr:hydroxymethylglutaryl-CoA lyase [Gammaproteobacteria bacterium]
MIEIVEVAPRDGFQSIRTPLATKTKVDIIHALADSGCRRIEAGAFVSPKAIPQMRDMADIAAALQPKENVRYMVLVPNQRGIELAINSGFTEFGYVFSASESHNQNNVRRSVQTSMDELIRLVDYLHSTPIDWRLRVNLATTFDCPFEGRQPTHRVMDLIAFIQAQVPQAEIALCDTTGRANPRQVGELSAALLETYRDQNTTWAFHGHDTYGLGVANALAAYAAGIRVFDTAAAGLGGCPFAPGATGNTATEDLVFAFEESGIPTGIDLHRLLDVADTIAALPGGVIGSHLRHVPRARL